MNHRTAYPRTCLLGLLTILALAAPRRADACSIISPEYGLTIKEANEDRQIASDGVLAFDAVILGETPEVALARFSLTLTPEAGGPAITGELGHKLLGTEPYTAIDSFQDIALVWRPAMPLAPGVYTANATLQGPWEQPAMWDFSVLVVDTPAPPLSPPRVDSVEAAVFDDQQLERICCETSLDSCGESSLCEPLRVLVVPGFTIRAALDPADIERAYLWVAPWDGQAAGPPFERTVPWHRETDLPTYAEWTWLNDFRLPDAAGEFCLVVGATSLIDDSTVLSAPICRELTAAHEEPRTITLSTESTGGSQCLTAPVYERDGSPYPPEPDSNAGCRLADANPGAGPLALLLLLAARRRRIPTR